MLTIFHGTSLHQVKYQHMSTGQVKILILSREMSVGNKRHFISTDPRPRLHLCCQNWGVLLRGQGKTKLECIWNVLNIKLSFRVFASVFIELRCFRNTHHMNQLSGGPHPWYISWKFWTFWPNSWNVLRLESWSMDYLPWKILFR